MSASTIKADVTLQNESTIDMVLNFMYAMRFELIFALGVCALWATGALSSSAKKVGVKTNNKPAAKSQARRPPGSAGKEPEDLTDFDALYPYLVHLCSSNVQKALEVYEASLEAGLDLEAAPVTQRDKAIAALTLSLIRANLPSKVIPLARNLKAKFKDVHIPTEVQTSIIKLMVAGQHFEDTISFYDLMGKDFDSSDKTGWSCILFSAVECRQYKRCSALFERLQSVGAPTQKDYWNMARCGSAQGDWNMLLKLLREMRANSVEVDNVTFNTALAACVSADRIDKARELLDELEGAGGLSDAITYNTLMKGYSKQGKLDSCFEIYELMRLRKLSPSQVTYGILLDACVSHNEVDRASKVFDMMTNDGVPMNTVLYTTLIKGFAREGKVDEATRVFNKMRAASGVSPDLITFSILLKANCDACRLEAALSLLDEMLKMGVRPDEVIFNNLLSGCAKQEKSDLAKRLYSDMTKCGIKPSNATFSILIRLYAQCNLLEDACEMLRTEPTKHKVSLESRIFVQLIQSCIRARQGRRAIEVYEAMCRQSSTSASANSSILGMCSKLNMYDTAVELLEVAAAKKVRVDSRDANAVLEGALKKKKSACVQSCIESMRALGIAVDSNLADKC